MLYFKNQKSTLFNTTTFGNSQGQTFFKIRLEFPKRPKLTNSTVQTDSIN